MKRIVALIVSMISTTAVAAPGSAVQHLMSEPASLFDIGMYGLRQYMQDAVKVWFPNERMVRVAAVYSPNDDEIYLHLSNPLAKADPNEALGLCNKFIRMARRDLRPSTSGEPASPLELLFSHDGYAKPNQPKDIYKGLAAHVTLTCNAGYRGGQVKETGKLLGGAVYHDVQKAS